MAIPVLLDDVKLFLRVDTTTEDDMILALAEAATDYAEQFCRRRFVTATVVEKFDAFPNTFRPRYSPLVAVTSIGYTDDNGTAQTVATSVYDVDTTTEPGRVFLKYSQVWPSARSIENSVTLTYTAGYGTAEEVPEGVKAAIKMLVAHWYEHREGVNVGNIVTPLPMTIESLLWQHRIPESG